MKKLLLGIVTISVLAGCASQSTKEQPKAADSEKPIAQKVDEPKPAPQQPVAIDPLKDPSNILSKRSVYYDFDNSGIKDEYKPLIEAHAKYLAAHPNAHVTVQGNTDERGSREYNVALGNRRAESLKEMLKALGASNTQIQTVSYGEEKPKATCHEESCWKENRRGDIIYQGEQ